MTDASNLQPTLVGDTLDLRPTTADDWEGLFAVASDPMIWERHPARDRWQEEVFRRYFHDAMTSNGAMTVRDKATGGIIGASRYSTERALEGEIEIGWTFLAREYWGGAANREMKQLMIGHALQFFESVIFLVGETNIRSRRAMEKIGGVLIDRVYDAPAAGGIARHVIYRIGEPI